MSTYINVVDGGDDLLSKVKGQQQAGRFALLEQQRLKELEQEKKKQEETKKDQGRKLDPTPFKRQLIAHRHPGDLTPLVVSWRGTWTPSQPHVVTNNQLGFAPTDAPWVFTYKGTGTLTPNPIRFASTADLSSVTQGVRAAIGSVDIVSHVSGVTWPTQSFANYWVTKVQHGESMADPWIDIEPIPALANAIGPATYQPTGTIAVSTAGVVFVTLKLPDAPRSYSTMTYEQSSAAGNPNDTLITNQMRYKTVLNGYRPWAMLGATFRGTPADQLDTPYLFLQIERNGAITEQQATKPAAQSFGDFYRANCFSGDPSAPVRGLYDGYYQVNGQVATILRLKAAGAYVDFPFGGMRQFIGAGAEVPSIPSSVSFELHRYNLPSWTTDAQLAGLLTNCVAPGGTGTPPDSTKKVHCQDVLYTRAKDRMGSDTGEALTDNFFMVYPL